MSVVNHVLFFLLETECNNSEELRSNDPRELRGDSCSNPVVIHW